MSVQTGSARLRSEGLYDQIMVERHRRMVDSAARRLARELNTYGCPAPRSKLARRAGVDHWSKATLDEAVAAGERIGLFRSLPMGWVAPAEPLGSVTNRRTAGIDPRPNSPARP
ncbi:MAG: hypothetical protein ACRDKD_10245 [Solirubrobacteraceae bacterium]